MWSVWRRSSTLVQVIVVVVGWEVGFLRGDLGRLGEGFDDGLEGGFLLRKGE